MVDAAWSTTRKPYPMPTLENDETFTGTRLHHTRYGEPAYLGQSQEPWQRLHASNTMASARRRNAGQHHQVPRDSLDFVLQSLYDHHSGFLQGKNETLVQRETLDSLDGRWALKTRVEENPDSGNPSGLPLRRFTVPNKETIHAIAGAIQSHHSAATNRGYSRKQDGGFYCT